MRIFSTFTGIGGFELGIQNAYRNKNGFGSSQAETNNERDRQGFQQSQRQDSSTSERSASSGTADRIDERPLFVGYSEVDKYASSVYEKHFKGVRNYADITKINEKELPDFDCLVGGFPCQAFSIAGKRGGFSDTRGTLFFDLARILRQKQPRLFVFENVKGLLSHDQGRTFSTIIATIDELGYDCQWQVLNSKNFGVPQNRERVIIVGHLRGTPRPEVFPIREHHQETAIKGLSTISAVTGVKGVTHSPTLDTMYMKGLGSKQARPGVVQLNNPKHSNDRLYSKEGISPTLNTMQGGNRQPFIEDIKIRRLTPLECERLQAFPDNWTQYGKDGEPISDTQRYKMCGNAVTTNVIQAVFERILS